MAKRRKKRARRRVARKNPRALAVLYARRGSTILKYDGRNFTRHGRAKLFSSRTAALTKAVELVRRHGRMLKGWKLYAR